MKSQLLPMASLQAHNKAYDLAFCVQTLALQHSIMV